MSDKENSEEEKSLLEKKKEDRTVGFLDKNAFERATAIGYEIGKNVCNIAECFSDETGDRTERFIKGLDSTMRLASSVYSIWFGMNSALEDKMKVINPNKVGEVTIDDLIKEIDKRNKLINILKSRIEELEEEKEQ